MPRGTKRGRIGREVVIAGGVHGWKLHQSKAVEDSRRQSKTVVVSFQFGVTIFDCLRLPSTIFDLLLTIERRNHMLPPTV
jgi:hypothetical protein